MGQCYSVSALFKFKNNNPTEFCNLIKQEAEDRNFLRRNMYDLNDPMECFRILTDNKVYKAYDNNNVWEADFDATYGWDSVMREVFGKAMDVLDNGSYVHVAPDGYDWIIEKKNGKVLTEYHEDE